MQANYVRIICALGLGRTYMALSTLYIADLFPLSHPLRGVAMLIAHNVHNCLRFYVGFYPSTQVVIWTHIVCGSVLVSLDPSGINYAAPSS